ncbi:MAG: M12 family metallopeptidase [Dysgonamonadaceae bacterium]|jgi:hypothetical protein|nr:M12 family metallopeptidase [Dysgonamonadaceae bacterium]
MKILNHWILLLVLFFYSCSSSVEDGEIFEKKSESKSFVVESAHLGKGELITLPNGIVVEKIGNFYVFEGDIVLNEEQKDKLGSNTTLRSTINVADRWPQGIIYYSINPSLTNTFRVTDAIAHWENETNIRFAPKTSANNNYLEFVPDNEGCYSDGIGYRGGHQVIGLANECSTGNVIHEIGHVLGLWHEHTRPDRDNYVSINWNNISNGYENQFETSSNNYAFGPFDFGSVMMYPSDAFSKNGLTTIERLGGLTYSAQRNGLSPGDIAGIQSIYPYLLWPKQRLIAVAATNETYYTSLWSREGFNNWLSLSMTSKPNWVTNVAISQNLTSDGNTDLNFDVNESGFQRTGKILFTQAQSGMIHEVVVNQQSTTGSLNVRLYGGGATSQVAHVELWIDNTQQNITPYWSVTSSGSDLPLICQIPYAGQYTEESEFTMLLDFLSRKISFFQLISTSSTISITEGGVDSRTIKIKGKLKDIQNVPNIAYLSLVDF